MHCRRIPTNLTGIQPSRAEWAKIYLKKTQSFPAGLYDISYVDILRYYSTFKAMGTIGIYPLSSIIYVSQ